MPIVPVGNLILQVPQGQHLDFVRQLEHQIQAFLPQVAARVLEESLRLEVDQYLVRKRYVRRKKAKRQTGGPYCSRCRTHQRQNFYRNGHYPRSLLTGYGRLRLQVPQLKCKCGGHVKFPFRTLRARQRVWEDLSWQVQLAYGQGLSYRQIKTHLDEQLHTSCGLGTLNRQVLQTVQSESSFHLTSWGEAPPVVRVDGIWITVMLATGDRQTDASGRKRAVKRAKRLPILAAQGVWPASGRTVLLAWQVADGEDRASWQTFLEHLYLAGVTPENGLCLLAADGSQGFRAAYENVYWRVPFQRCVFHKLHNVAQAIRTPAGMDRETAHTYRTQFLREAGRIWQAVDEHEARQRHAAFCQQWEATQAKAVETLKRDLNETLAFYAVQEKAAEQGHDWPSHLLRTTSPLERMFREFRRRYRNALLFHSIAGAEAVTTQIAARFS
jgi:transposase-like protein